MLSEKAKRIHRNLWEQISLAVDKLDPKDYRDVLEELYTDIESRLDVLEPMDGIE